MIEEGLITVVSRRSVGDTMDALASAATAKGFTVFARIDHAANAASVGMKLRPTQLLVFGSPKSGTVLMEENQVTGIDLPLRVLAWEDENGEAWLTYPDVTWIAKRHGLGVSVDDTIKAIGASLAGLAITAASM